MSKIIDGLTTIFVFTLSICFVWNEASQLVLADRAGLSFVFGLVALYIVSSVYRNDKSSKSNASVLVSDGSTKPADLPANLDSGTSEETDLSNLTLPELFAKAIEYSIADEVETVQEEQPKAKRKYTRKAKPILEVVQEPSSKVESDDNSRVTTELESTSESNSEPASKTPAKARKNAKTEVSSIEPKAKTAAKARKTSATVKEKVGEDKPKSSSSTAKKPGSTSARRTSKAKLEATDKE